MSRYKRKADAGATDSPWDITQPIYQAYGTGMVRAVTWFLFAMMIGCLFAAQAVYRVRIVNDGGQSVSPYSEPAIMAVVIGGLGVGMFLAMLIYLRRYAVRLLLLPDTQHLRVTTLRLFGTEDRDEPFSALSQAKFHHGRWDSMWTPSVNAPYFWVRVKGGRSFLLDMSGEFRNRKGLDGLLGLDEAVQNAPESR